MHSLVNLYACCINLFVLLQTRKYRCPVWCGILLEDLSNGRNNSKCRCFCRTLMFWLNEGAVLVSLLYHYYTVTNQFNDEYDLGGISSRTPDNTIQHYFVDRVLCREQSEARRWNWNRYTVYAMAKSSALSLFCEWCKRIRSAIAILQLFVCNVPELRGNGKR